MLLNFWVELEFELSQTESNFTSRINGRTKKVERFMLYILHHNVISLSITSHTMKDDLRLIVINFDMTSDVT